MTSHNDIGHDQRGAIMILGLFMALALIGILWFMLGIGATIVFHEKMQQAADSAAFSAAAVHARDMNLIVAINMVMFVLVGVWLVLCVTYTVMEIVSIYTWIAGIVSCIVGCEGLEVSADVEEIKELVGEMKQVYQEGLDAILPALSIVQEVIADTTDAKGTAMTALAAAASQKDQGFEGAGFSADVPNPEGIRQIGKRIALPIENEKNSALCGHVVNWVIGYVQTLLERNPIVKKLMNMSATEKLAMKLAFSKYITANPLAGLAIDDFGKMLDEVRSMTSKGLQTLYCAGGVWDQAGPKRLYRSDPKSQSSMEKNASDWMQIWSVIVPTDGIDDNDAEHKIGIASRTHQVHSDPSALASFKYAQAEYYFDCSGKWASGDCNAISNEVTDTGIDASMYRLEWRARLVRVHTPKSLPGASVISAANTVLSSRATVKKLEDSGPAAPIVRKAFSTLPSSVLDFINAVPAGSFH